MAAGCVGSGDGIVSRELRGERAERSSTDVAGIVAHNVVARAAYGAVVRVSERAILRVCEHDAVSVGERTGVQYAAGIDTAVGGEGRPFGAVVDVSVDIDPDAAEYECGDEQRRHGAAFDLIHARAPFPALVGFAAFTTKLPPRRVSADLM